MCPRPMGMVAKRSVADVDQEKVAGFGSVRKAAH